MKVTVHTRLGKKYEFKAKSVDLSNKTLIVWFEEEDDLKQTVFPMSEVVSVHIM